MGTISRSFTATTGETILAADIETDFNAVFNEFNGSIEAANIAAGAVGTTQLAATSVTSAKLASSSVVEAKIDYTSANSGPKVVRIPDYMGANGATMAGLRYSFTRGGGTTESETIDLTDAGNYPSLSTAPSFSATPVLLGAPISDTTVANDQITSAAINAISSTSLTLDMTFPGATSNAITIEFGLIGAD